jgi:hypothetical protein
MGRYKNRIVLDRYRLVNSTTIVFWQPLIFTQDLERVFKNRWLVLRSLFKRTLLGLVINFGLGVVIQINYYFRYLDFCLIHNNFYMNLIMDYDLMP